MANNVSVSITADVADLTAKLAIARADVAATSKTLNDLAKAANAGDMTAEMKSSLLAAGDATAKARNQAALYSRELKAMSPALDGAAHGSAGVTREMLVLGREASRGNLTKMAGSATILAQRMGLLTPEVLAGAAAIAALAAPFATFIIAAEQGSEELARFENAMAATNGYAGVTISQLQNMSRELSTFAHESVGAATEEMMKLAASGTFTGKTMLLVGEDAERMAALTGENADKFNEQFLKMSGGVAKFAKEYQDRYHQLTTAQYEYIRQLEEQGRKEEAEYQLAKDVYDYLGQQAPENLGYLERAWHGVRDAISEAWDKLKSFGRDSNQDQLDRINDQLAALKNPNRRLSDASDPTADAAAIASLEKQKKAIEDREKAEQKSAATRAASARTQTEGVDAAAKLKDQFEDSKTSGEKLHARIREINEELQKAVAANPQQKALYEQEAAAARAQAEKSFTPHAPKTHGPDITSVWAEQLHQQEILSGEYFKDQTANELAFWQSKLALTTGGSKEWLAVQSKIYEASKAIAHQSYEQQLADLNEKIAADRDSWAKEQADWQAKLALIRKTFGEQSAEYKNAHRGFEAAQREHDDREEAEAQKHAQKMVDALRRDLDAQAKVRDDDTKAAETMIKANAGNTPLGDISAEVQLAQIHAQNIRQKIADNETWYAAQNAANDKAIAAAEAKYADDKSRYQNLLDEKAQADQKYADTKSELDSQMRMQSIQDILAIQQAYHGYTDGIVNSSVTGFDGVLSRQRSWAQMGIGIYGTVAHQFEQQLARMVSNWIVQHLFMTAAQRAQLAVQSAQHAAANAAAATSGIASAKIQAAALVGLAGAGGVASMAAAPFPLDLGAPAFGASMAASAASLASFDKGTNVLPNDMIAQVHAGERIVPAADNAELLKLTARGAGAGAEPQRGDMHLHYAPTIHGQMPFADQLAAHESNVISIMQRAHRRGALRFS